MRFVWNLVSPSRYFLYRAQNNSLNVSDLDITAIDQSAIIH